MALSKAAQEYLMALETARKENVAKGGEEAGRALIADQRRQGMELSGKKKVYKRDDKVVKAAKDRLQVKRAPASSAGASRAETRLDRDRFRADSDKFEQQQKEENKPKGPGGVNLSSPQAVEERAKAGRRSDRAASFVDRILKPLPGGR